MTREDSPRSLLPALALTTSLGVLLLALAGKAGREDTGYEQVFLWTGLVVLFLPVAVRLCTSSAPRGERLWGVVFVGMGLFAFKYLNDPLAFTNHDELGHIRSVDDLTRTGDLFTSNPLVDAYPRYPGLLLAANALTQLGGLGVFPAGLLLIGAARLMTVVALFLIFERVSGSARIAGVASLLYMGNPGFVYFDSQFAYESMALALGAALLAVVLPRSQPDDIVPRLPLALVLGGALLITHHLSSYAVLAFLIIWALLELVARRPRATGPQRPAIAAVMLGAGVAIWLLFAASGTGGYIEPVLKGSVDGLSSILFGGSSGKALFDAPDAAIDPVWVQVIGFLSVGLLLVGLAYGAWRLLRDKAQGALMVAFGVAAIAYPATLALRLSQAGTETSNRASEFVFVGLGLVIAAAGVFLLSGRRGGKGWLALGAVYVTIVFLGGIIVGSGPFSRLPGPYEVGADTRSVDPLGVAAARWEKLHLPSGARVLTDRSNSQLSVAYSDIEPQGGAFRGKRVATVFFTEQFGPAQNELIQGAGVDYLVVDMRLSRGLPLIGRYFERGEPATKTPIRAAALRKFDAVPGLSRIYDNGQIVVYQARGIRCEPGGKTCAS